MQHLAVVSETALGTVVGRGHEPVERHRDVENHLAHGGFLLRRSADDL
jgi:hypothetical protein